MSVLTISDLVVTYPDGDSTITALDHVKLEVDAGEFVALVGESGSGKSTLLAVAAGLQTPTSGEVLLEGSPVADNRQQVGLVFQAANLISALTAREQLLIVDHMRGIKPRVKRADELLARVGLEGLHNRRPGQLSGGQRQRVNIARALMSSPTLLLADEPTSALDARLSREIVELLRDVTQEFNLATVMVTHDRSQIPMATRAVEMQGGHLSELELVP
ncbi:ABC transporter ATP-binding protein [Corynebacterium sp. 153RC1]|uniref:ABC transporter ATP-binding protein n=1 Tax=unclassified Corynebacterium TaxID=2624378 RepID=UPI00211C7029|nr:MULTISPECIES: ABC transporter ATP-binding protein [unclassified Corynebacterium]MCQ9352790.1 ABC transporter ATP-binding protein [Corynebacterium sp. 209RC1]MCQ9354974.1 ABC transporter ATP-binding protein [Corynebacterium sp. 1222RC1]MCQ9357235.1 ABC transporter ATP-binding protein [Corynebacterium sp. 122RC1]MCQ9359410.1 ABC transporter ATP-binding protein [Corynebacterium sp. 142RC1]MCQ9361632.1 ABC transporter ATP-binding protein [Corynebacterium sp. 153RC1]